MCESSLLSLLSSAVSARAAAALSGLPLSPFSSHSGSPQWSSHLDIAAPILLSGLSIQVQVNVDPSLELKSYPEWQKWGLAAKSDSFMWCIICDATEQWTFSFKVKTQKDLQKPNHKIGAIFSSNFNWNVQYNFCSANVAVQYCLQISAKGF